MSQKKFRYQLFFGGMGDAPFIGFLIGVIVCALITMCSSSCSHKTTSVLSSSADSLSISTNASTTLHTEGYLNVSTESLTDIIEKAERTWNATTTRTYYSAPDSLGNQYVTSQEQTTLQGGSTTQTHTTQKDTTSTASSQQSSAVLTDSTTLTTTHHQTTDKQTTPLPWYYQYPLYALILFIATALLYCLWSNLRKTTQVMS